MYVSINKFQSCSRNSIKNNSIFKDGKGVIVFISQKPVTELKILGLEHKKKMFN